MNNEKRVNKLSKKYYTLVFGVIMGFIMSVLTSLAVTIINIGFVHNFFQMWFNFFLTTFAIGFPMTIMITPFVKNIADRITISEQQSKPNSRLIDVIRSIRTLTYFCKNCGGQISGQ